MRIDALRVSRFKCLLDIELPCLSRVTLLGGPNCVGKTAVLEAIFLFFDRNNAGSLLRQFGWRGIPSVALEPNEMCAPFFFDFDLGRDIVIEMKRGRRHEKLTVSFLPRWHNGEISSRAVDQRDRKPYVKTDFQQAVPFALEFKYQENRKPVEIRRLKIDLEKPFFDGGEEPTESTRAIMIFARRAGIPEEDAQRFGNLDRLGRTDDVLEFTKRFFPQVSGLSLIPGADRKPLLYADVGLARKVPVGWAGEGLSRLLSIYLAMADAKGGVVLIDEIGGGIHYSALAKFWRGLAEAAEKYDCQVFATTHSYECIQAAHEGLGGLLAPDFTYVLLDKTEKGIVPKCYPYGNLGAALDVGLELRG
jgi:hypothetical protein